MRDSHQMIITTVCKLVSRISVRLDQDHVVQFCIVYGNVAIDLIFKSGCACSRVVLTDDIRDSGCKLLFYFFLGQVQTMLVIDGNLFSCNRCL